MKLPSHIYIVQFSIQIEVFVMKLTPLVVERIQQEVGKV